MFLNREEAGIPRGGVIVGKVASEILKIPLSILIVKKIAAPHNPELAIGATGSDGVVFWDENLIGYLDISGKEKDKALSLTIKTLKPREKQLGITIPVARRKTIIVVD